MLGSLISSFRRRTATGAAVALLAAAMVPLAASPAAAAVITVSITADTVADDGDCSLREAIIAANDNVATGLADGECPAGSSSETDTVTVPAGIYPLGDALVALNNAGAVDDLHITGAGADVTVLDSGGADRIFTLGAGATATIAGVTITNGFTNTSGGGIFNAGNLTVNDSTLSANQTFVPSDHAVFGAAIHNTNVGTLTVTNSTLSANKVSCGTDCGGGGAGIYNQGGTVTVANSTLSGNEVSCVTGCVAVGAGIYNVGGTVTVTSSTLSGNVAFCTDVQPCGLISGAGIQADGTTTLLATIVANNQVNGASGNCGGTIGEPANAFNLEFPGDTCLFADFPDTDPLLGPLANNGGRTQTHALTAGSPAIDRVAVGCPPPGTDQRGVTRPQDGNGDGIALCDIGAFEFVRSPGGGGGGDDDDDGGGSGRRGRITIVEQVEGRDATFGFHTKELRQKTFRLGDDARRVFRDLRSGTYTVAQDKKDGWKLSRIVCQDPTRNTKVVLDTRRAVIKLRAGEHVTCTFTNRRK